MRGGRRIQHVLTRAGREKEETGILPRPSWCTIGLSKQEE